MAQPLPGGVYSGTLSYADVYPAHKGIGGIGTQDRALPAFAEAQLASAAGSMMLGAAMHDQLVGKPAGWYVAALVVLLILAWSMR